MGVWIETPSAPCSSFRAQSHPSWVCGLKQHLRRRKRQRIRRHTLRGCVDWNTLIWTIEEPLIVTPFVGVWIETLLMPLRLIWLSGHTLRGCVDWNTINGKSAEQNDLSHPSWVCGLKLVVKSDQAGQSDVTPFVGVWIETAFCMLRQQWSSSHTLRGCVDWNPLLALLFYLLGVTPFVGVWIETLQNLTIFPEPAVTPFVGVWIETSLLKNLHARQPVTPFVGVWIETDQKEIAERIADVTPFVGVWIETWTFWWYLRDTPVTPFVGVWIETKEYGQHQHEHSVTPFVGVWIETNIVLASMLPSSCHTLRGCVDWNYRVTEELTIDVGHTLRGCVDWNLNTETLVTDDDKSHPSWVCGMKQKTDFIFWAHLKKKSFLRKRAIDCQ